MSDDKKPSPDDAPIVTSLDEITAGGPVLWTSDAMIAHGGEAIFALPGDGQRGSWRDPWTAATGQPMHALISVPRRAARPDLGPFPDALSDLHDAIDAYAVARIERSRDCATDGEVASAMKAVDDAIDAVVRTGGPR